MYLQLPVYPICAAITQNKDSVLPFSGIFLTHGFNINPSNLEDVLKIGVELEREWDFMLFDAIVVNREPVVYCTFSTVNDALKGDAQGLFRDRLAGFELQFLICEFELRYRAPFRRRAQRIGRCPGDLECISVEVPAIMVVQTKAVLIASRNTAVMLCQEENLFIFDNDCTSYTARDHRSGRIQ